MEDAVVLYPSPERGHLNSMVELGKLILKNHPSFSITILILTPPNTMITSTAQYISTVSSAFPSITFHHLPSAPLPPSSSVEELCYLLPRFNNPNVHRALQSISNTSKLKAFVIDFFCDAAFEVATNLNIPTYYYFTGGAYALGAFLYFSTIHQTLDKDLKDLKNTLLDFPGLASIPVSDMPRALFDRSAKVYGDFLNTAILMAKSNGIILNTFELLEAKAIKAISDGLCVPNGPTPPIFPVGPLISTNNDQDGDDRHECLNWLNSQPSRSVLFLCFGSKGLFPAKQLKEIATGLEKSGQRFVWVVRNPPPENDKEPNLDVILPEGFLERTKGRGLVVKQWAPQVSVLSHDSVGGFVTHCGWNSVLEALCGGVAMIAWPLYAEQGMNRVFLVEEMKVALMVNKSSEEDGLVSATELEKRVRELFDSEVGKEVRERVLAMKDGGIAAMKDGGSSHVALAKLAESWKKN